MSGRSSDWSTPADVVTKVRRHWASGVLLAAWAHGLPFEPVSIPLRGPAAGEIAADLDRVRDWVAGLERGSRHHRKPVYRLELKPVGGRALGSNQLPARAWVETYEAAWRLLGVENQVTEFTSLLELTRAEQPELAGWVANHPLCVLPLVDVWPQLLATTAWIESHRGTGRYLRQIDVPGVDTKFIEQHRGVLADLLDVLLGPSAVVDDAAPSAPRTDLARRYGFFARPASVRLRFGDDAFADGVFAGLSEATVRLEELSRLEATAHRVFILENEITYLAFPVLPGSLVIFGAGYTVSTAGSLPWLAAKEVWYWGDLDTHGFAILNRLRHTCPAVGSLLMDRATLLEHRDRWVTEPKPTRAHLDGLTPSENDLYQDLVEDVFGPSVRLEQERVSWADVLSAVTQTKEKSRFTGGGR